MSLGRATACAARIRTNRTRGARMSKHPCLTRWSRRRVLSAMGTAAAALAVGHRTFAAPSFPAGSIIRTVLKDYAPDDLSGGATLFHEHMSFAPDFLKRFDQFALETNAANGTSAPIAQPNDVSFMHDLGLM